VLGRILDVAAIPTQEKVRGSLGGNDLSGRFYVGRNYSVIG
jgi:hypothetical protein